MVKVSDIYKGIIKHYIWENYSDAKERLLRNKYTTLQQKLVLCDKSEFKVFFSLIQTNPIHPFYKMIRKCVLRA